MRQPPEGYRELDAPSSVRVRDLLLLTRGWREVVYLGLDHVTVAVGTSIQRIHRVDARKLRVARWKSGVRGERYAPPSKQIWGPVQRSLATNIAIEMLQARLAAGLTVTDVAELTGMPRSFVWSVEGGKRLPNILTLVRYCRALDVDPSAVLDRALKRETKPKRPARARRARSATSSLPEAARRP